HMKGYFSNHAEEAARTITAESGKAIKSARVEVQRAIHIIEDGVEECKRLGGETIPLDRRPWGESRMALLERVPRGIVAGITPFNFPLHLVGHKIVPALASRNAIIIKPASQTPLSALFWAKAFDLAGLPSGALSVLPAGPASAAPLIDDPRVKAISFTGSDTVGWQLKARAPKKHVSLELGGNAGAIVHSDGNLQLAASTLALGAFALAGQSCISTQRIFAHEDVYDDFASLLKAEADKMTVGDPADDDTDIGPVISASDAERIEQWVQNAVDQGAQVLSGNRREGNLYWPTVLTHTTPEMKVNREEVFGPVVTLTPYRKFDEALEMANNSRFGLQAAVFTNDVRLINRAYRSLEVGGVMVNQAPTWRIDHMPYGGVKDSGEGREGVRFAMQAMTEPRLLVINFPDDI
ncbi:MAG: aldehyde dehydrogenase family protein, partial [Candidatus Marinimicrobia bacterium]|nr:aldehyde dehydrogenase family protein [Candidatus Neomarinimicrobiota bacterium]